MSNSDPTYEELLAAKAEGMLKVCGRCGVPLNTLTETSTGNVTYLHSQAYRNHDHDPIPTLVDPSGPGVSSDCDFCGTSRPMHWSFLGKRVEIDHPALVDGELGAMATNDYGERWAACKECGEAINAEDYRELLRLCRARSAMVRRMRRQDPDAEDTLLQSFSLLWGQYLPSIYQRDYIGPRAEATRLNPRMLPKIQIALMNFWSDNAYRDVLGKRHRSVHAIPGVHTGDEDTFAVYYKPGDPIPGPVLKNHLDHLRAGIGVSSLYWISAKFTQLAIMAGQDFDKLSITREDLPSSFGLMVFEEPIGEIESLFGTAHIRAASWTLVPGGVWINVYTQPEQGARSDYDVLQGRARYGYLLPTSTGGGMPFGDEQHVGPDDSGNTPSSFAAATILATWFLLAQPGVAETTPAPVDKKLARAFQRQNARPLPAVQIVDLRKQPVRQNSREIGPRGPLTVRVYRKGHWKHQAYGPKHGLRKMIYVSSYIAGPDNAPLKDTRPTVRVLR